MNGFGYGQGEPRELVLRRQLNEQASMLAACLTDVQATMDELTRELEAKDAKLKRVREAVS